MNDENLQALAALAQTLGTTTKYLWAALLRQATVSAVLGLAGVGFWGLAAAFGFWWVRRKTTEPKATPGNHLPKADWTDEKAIVAWGCAVVFALLVAGWAGDVLPNALAALANPEYWALLQATRMMK